MIFLLNTISVLSLSGLSLPACPSASPCFSVSVCDAFIEFSYFSVHSLFNATSRFRANGCLFCSWTQFKLLRAGASEATRAEDVSAGHGERGPDCGGCRYVVSPKPALQNGIRFISDELGA